MNVKSIKNKIIYLVDIILPIPVNKIFTFYCNHEDIKKIEVGYRVIVPFGKMNNEKIGFVYKINKSRNEKRKNYKKIKSVIDKKPIITRNQIKLLKWIAEYYISNITKTFNLIIPGYLMKKKIFENYKPKKKYFIKINDNVNIEEIIKKNKYKSQTEIINTYSKIIKNEGKNYEIGIEKITNSNHSKNSLNTLIKNKILNKYEKNISRIEKSISYNKSDSLNKIEFSFFKKILKLFNQKDAILFIESNYERRINVYIHLIEKEIKKGNRILYMVPELFFRNKIIKKIKNIYGEKVGIYDPKKSNNYKIENYNNIINDKYDIIIGIKSSIFLPIRRLSLVIIEDEFDPLFKESMREPRYNARDVSIIYSKINNNKVLLGTSNPSLESYYNSLNNNFGIVKNKRKKNKEIILINSLEKKLKEKIKGNFSDTLIKTINNNINRNKQVIIYNNKKNELQNLKNELDDIFPKINKGIIHLDLKRKDFNNIINNILNNEIKIIIGNQIVKRILLLTDISLIGIINAEKMLNIPNFRAMEKTFQFINQIINENYFNDYQFRKIIIQTLDPNIKIYNFLKNDEWEKFFENELQERKKFNYPPFNKLIKIEFKNRSSKIAEIEAKSFSNKVKRIIDENNILGPIKSRIDKIEMFLKISRNYKETRKIKKNISLKNKNIKPKSIISFDVDP